MAFSVFLDANIILDFVLKRSQYEQAKSIIAQAEQGKIKGFVSPSVVQICAYWTAKAYGIPKTKEIMGALLTFLTSIDIPHENVLSAIHSSMDDIEDALLYYTARYHRLDFVISRDLAFQKTALPSLPVLSPEDFSRLLR